MVPYLNEGRDKTTCNFDEKNDSSDQSVVDSKFSTEAVDVDKIESNSTQTNSSILHLLGWNKNFSNLFRPGLSVVYFHQLTGACSGESWLKYFFCHFQTVRSPLPKAF